MPRTAAIAAYLKICEPGPSAVRLHNNCAAGGPRVPALDRHRTFPADFAQTYQGIGAMPSPALPKEIVTSPRRHRRVEDAGPGSIVCHEVPLGQRRLCAGVSQPSPLGGTTKPNQGPSMGRLSAWPIDGPLSYQVS